MRTWFARVMVACTLLFAGAAQAQQPFLTGCVEGGLAGYMTCRLTPDAFTEWAYDSGHGVAPRDIPNRGYLSLDKAVYETLNYLVYSSPNFASICEFSHWLGATTVLQRDTFVQSQQPLWQHTELHIKSGLKTSDGSCGGVGTVVVLVHAQRSAYCKKAPE